MCVSEVIEQLQLEFPRWTIAPNPENEHTHIMLWRGGPMPERSRDDCFAAIYISGGIIRAWPVSGKSHVFGDPMSAAEYATGEKQASHANEAEVPRKSDQIRPAHYGGPEDPYECIKVIRAWGLNFELGNVAKYLSRAGKKPGVDAVDDLRELITYAQMEIDRRETKP